MLFLETSEEAPPPAEVARSLRVLAAMGVLHKISGLLFGRPGDELSLQLELFAAYDQAILEVVNHEQGLADLPIVTQMDFGHTSPMFILPYGIQAEIDCEKKCFSILESAVIS